MIKYNSWDVECNVTKMLLFDDGRSEKKVPKCPIVDKYFSCETCKKKLISSILDGSFKDAEDGF
jgi:hypothetical protein